MAAGVVALAYDIHHIYADPASEWFVLRIVILVLLAWLSAPALAAEPLRLNTGVGAPYVLPDRQGFLDLLVAEMFRRVGLTAEVNVFPSAERALINANSGVDDGDAMRVRGLERLYPNLVRVDEKMIDNDFVAYSTRHRFMTRGWDDLKPYSVAYITGWKVFETNLKGGFQVTEVQDPEQLFTLLQGGRADAVLFEKWQGLWHARSRGLAVHEHQPPLLRTEMFLYVHTRHAALAAALAAALRQMKQDGSYAGLVERTLLPLAGSR